MRGFASYAIAYSHSQCKHGKPMRPLTPFDGPREDREYCIMLPCIFILVKCPGLI